jgi:rhomboid protease GluP
MAEIKKEKSEKTEKLSESCLNCDLSFKEVRRYEDTNLCVECIEQEWLADAVKSAGEPPDPPKKKIDIFEVTTRDMPVTSILLLSNIVIFFLSYIHPEGLSTLSLLRFGAKFTPLIDLGEYFRLITACFLHANIHHLAVNMFLLAILGYRIEPKMERSSYLLLYIVCGLAGSIMSTLGSIHVGVGASGAIFGLAGFLFMYGRKNWKDMAGQLDPQTYIYLGFSIFYNLISGFTQSGIDNFAHLGGLLAGVLIAVSGSGLKQYKVPSMILYLISFVILLYSLLLWCRTFYIKRSA